MIQGEIYKVKCPFCDKITEANRLTPFAVKLLCFNCHNWIDEENIISFARASMLDD